MSDGERLGTERLQLFHQSYNERVLCPLLATADSFLTALESILVGMFSVAAIKQDQKVRGGSFQVRFDEFRDDWPRIPMVNQFSKGNNSGNIVLT